MSCAANFKKMDKEDRRLLFKFLLDIFLLCVVGFPILFFYLWGRPYERGFFCDDESLRHPYHDSTVTNLMLYIFGLLVPISLMITIEFVRNRNGKSRNYITFMGRRIPPWVVESYKVIGVFAFGTACQQLTTDVAKYSIGRLRPHFIDVCKPDIDCALDEYKWKYIEDFKCLATDDKLLKEMRLSFPSGHSSFSAYTMLFLAFYLHNRLTWSGSKLLRHLIQFFLFVLTWYTAMSRVSDYKHHWSDVLAGFSVGIIYAVVIFRFLFDFSSVRKPLHEEEMLATNGNTARIV